MSAQQMGSEQILRATEYLCKYAAHVPHGKVDWKPDKTTKSVREILQHATEVNQFFASLISGRKPTQNGSAAQRSADYNQVVEDVRVSGQELANIIRNLRDEEMLQSRPAPQGKPWELPRAISTAGMHISYHWGQISYLQTLWGDVEDHF